MHKRLRLVGGVILTMGIGLSALCHAQQQSDQSAWETPSKLHQFNFLHGSMPGKLVTTTQENGRSNIVFETPTGGLLKLAKGAVIKTSREITPLMEDYQKRLAMLDKNSSAHHWAMAQWIKEAKAKKKLANEYEFHLQEVVRLDPSNESAWRALEYVDFNGTWRRPENKMRSHGYVPKGSGWIPRIMADRIKQRNAAEDNQGEQRGNLKKWKKNLSKLSEDQAVQALHQIASPSMVGELAKLAADSSNPRFRIMVLNAIGEIDSWPAQVELSKFAVADGNRGVRDQAITLLKQKKYNHAAIASRIASTTLISKNNVEVNRGAFVIGELGQANVLLPLIHALNTKHKVKNPTGSEPGRTNASFSNQGTSFNPGGGGPKVIERVFKNESVHTALRRMSDTDFGYDEARWKQWYTEQNTVLINDLRTDD